MSDAFLAGYHPKKTPMPIEIKKDSKIDAIETWTKTGVKLAIKKDTNIPNKEDGFDHMNDALGYMIDYIKPLVVQMPSSRPIRWTMK